MQADTYTGFSGAHLELIAAADTASRAIPPMWPLAATVAVNPYLGQANETLEQVAARLERVAGAAVTLPRAAFLEKINAGEITDADLAAACEAASPGGPTSVAALKAALTESPVAIAALPTVAELAADASGIDWPAIVTDRLGAWAAGYFDEGQALWAATPGLAAFDSWQVFASRDLTPEIAGLSGFAARVAALPRPARLGLSQTCDLLGVNPTAAETYFHQLLLGWAGWGQLAGRQLFEAEMKGETDSTVSDLLTIRLVWEAALLDRYRATIEDQWQTVLARHADPIEPEPRHIVDSILQDAAERAAQRRLAATLAISAPARGTARPNLQAAFCIDVRSERFRRALERQEEGIATLGFAGFFGLAAGHRDTASDVVEHRLPVLLVPQLQSDAPGANDTAKRFTARARRAWGRFRQAAVSSFAFVEASGPLYAGKLLADSFSTPKPSGTSARPRLDTAADLADRTNTAAAILRAMSLTENFAPVVLLLGHGAQVTNNAHASALQCGACGGHAGDVNARLLAGILNEPDLRAPLRKAGIALPDDTVFIAGLHDTTTDTVRLFEQDLDASPDLDRMRQIRGWLAAAGRETAVERAPNLPRAGNADRIARRALDWAETRAEWGLAGCNAFIAAPRYRTGGRSLEGRAFLHDYDGRKDPQFGTLELILTAPVVVASWISLAYYGAVVSPALFGGGNKLLHNVCGGVGALEGNGGMLRPGLPWQSVHDGSRFMHEPLRLSVVVEAPAEAINDILSRHPQVRSLFDNRWLHLMTLDAEGRMAQRYIGDLTWAPVPAPHPGEGSAEPVQNCEAA